MTGRRFALNTPEAEAIIGGLRRQHYPRVRPDYTAVLWVGTHLAIVRTYAGPRTSASVHLYSLKEHVTVRGTRTRRVKSLWQGTDGPISRARLDEWIEEAVTFDTGWLAAQATRKAALLARRAWEKERAGCAADVRDSQMALLEVARQLDSRDGYDLRAAAEVYRAAVTRRAECVAREVADPRNIL